MAMEMPMRKDREGHGHIRFFITCVLFFFRRRDKDERNITNIRDDKQDDIDMQYETDLLCRFVLDGLGRKVGESVAVNDDILIIKSGKKYLGVPLKHVTDEGKTLLVRGLMDLEKAEELGEKWRRESIPRDTFFLSKSENEGKNIEYRERMREYEK